MRFLADMGISPRIVERLRALGYEAVHLHDVGLDRLPDVDIMAKALQENAIILTHDLDFSELLALSGARLPSVITFRLRDMRPANVYRHLTALLAQHRQAVERGAIVTVTEQRIRMRRLPIVKSG
jgi:predicted nuclease of predicted toxin-antitoxin system